MAAAVYVGEGALEVREVPSPELRHGEVLIEVSHCGICGTDLHLVLEGYARPGTILGHEWAGTVVAAGPGVAGWEPGARVVAGPAPGCGACRACRSGRPSVCHERPAGDLLEFRGAFCRFVTVPAARLVALPDGLSTRTAALTEPTAIALHTVDLSGAAPGDAVLVTGAGPVGLLTIAVLRARGVTDITVSEPAPGRRQRALAVGARRAVAPDELPRAPLGRPVSDAVVVAFECSGNARAARSALAQLEPAGTLVFVGTGAEQPRVDHNRMIVLELTAIGAYNYGADGFAGALALLGSEALPVDLLIEPDDIGLDALLETMRSLARGDPPGKVMVRPVRGARRDDAR
jgi:2-desacetyl-2-hydroxyethyl bacteriochlorophyllide A dehydrogenase